MGVINGISYDEFPKQNEDFLKVGTRVKIFYNFDTSRYHYGEVVRCDVEYPNTTIIKRDDGKYLTGFECQYSPIYDGSQKPHIYRVGISIASLETMKVGFENIQLIAALSEYEAMQIYNKKNGCSYSRIVDIIQ